MVKFNQDTVAKQEAVPLSPVQSLHKEIAFQQSFAFDLSERAVTALAEGDAESAEYARQIWADTQTKITELEGRLELERVKQISEIAPTIGALVLRSSSLLGGEPRFKEMRSLFATRVEKDMLSPRELKRPENLLYKSEHPTNTFIRQN